MKHIAKVLVLAFMLTTVCSFLVSCGGGGLEIQKQEDGTCYVIGYGDFEGTELEIPDTIDGCKVVGVGGLSDNETITKIVVPDTVTIIAMGAFKNCEKLTDIQLPDSLESLGAGAFNGCTSLKSFKIPSGVTVIAASTFIGCTALTEVEIHENVTVIRENAFNGCTALTSVEIPSYLKLLGQGAFQGCSSLTEVKVGKVDQMGMMAFDSCTSLKEISLGKIESYPTIGSVISNCPALETLTFGGEYIPSGAFGVLPALKTVYIGKFVDRIGDAFKGCTALETIVYGGTTSQWREIDKSSGWSTDTGLKVVKCSDGDITFKE